MRACVCVCVYAFVYLPNKACVYASVSVCSAKRSVMSFCKGAITFSVGVLDLAAINLILKEHKIKHASQTEIYRIIKIF